MERVLYIVFVLSIILPFYTYLFYPLCLRLFTEKKYIESDYYPFVSVIVIGEDVDNKISNIKNCDYDKFEIINGNFEDSERAKGDIILFTDERTLLDKHAISEIVKSFSDEKIGAVVGQQINPKGNSLFWKYENYVRKYESKIGCVSGGNDTIFAIRKKDMPKVDRTVLNKPFYLATKINESGKDVVFNDFAKAYECDTNGTNFQKHVLDAAGYWQALRLFPKMLFFRHGSFVYISHRVLKWFVWLNMLFLLLITGVIGIYKNGFMLVLFFMQIATYLIIIALSRMNIRGWLGKIIKVGYYFFMLNVAYLVGLFCVGDKSK